MRFRELKRIDEALTNVKAAKGQVPFRRLGINDPELQNLINHVSTVTGVPAADIVKEMEEDVRKLEDVKKYSQRLYDAIAINSVESAAFNQIKKSSKLQQAPTENKKFKPSLFYDLINLVKKENPGFFPLSSPDPDDPRRLFKFNPVIVPTTDKKLQKYNSIGTAAVTPEGVFIFNIEFMEHLLMYAEVTGLQPAGKKYESNGGPFPNGYAYIEFLIMHEILHYVKGDFLTGRKNPQYSSTVHNYASDYRSNYQLVKSGYTQIPVGLFSDDFNFDREDTRNYRRLVKAVYEELKKIPKQLRAWVEEKIDPPDEHEPNKPPPPPQEPWQPNVGDYVVDQVDQGFAEIVKILPNGQYETKPVTIDQVKIRYPDIKIG
jgi:hypothetical protein